MPSNASRGAYYKNRTRKWLIDKGYDVADMEVVKWIHAKSREGHEARRVPMKRDQWGCDLVAKNAIEFLWIQVKSGNITGNFPDAKRKFDETVWPSAFGAIVSGGDVSNFRFYRRLIIAWAPRARAPRIVEC